MSVTPCTMWYGYAMATVTYRTSYDGTSPITMPAWSIGERVRKARTHAGLSRKEMADRINVSVRTLSRWENDVTTPRGSTLSLIALLCNVPVFWMLDVDPAEDGWRLYHLPDGTPYQPDDPEMMTDLVVGPDDPGPGMSEFVARRRMKLADSDVRSR